MADLRSELGGSDAHRGQIILVGAFALALVFVALALVMNAAIYTENLATRSESAETSNAHAFHRATETAATDAFHYAHAAHSGDKDALNQSVRDAIEAYNNATRRQQAAHTQMTNVSVASTYPGVNITDDPSDLSGSGGSDNLTLATGVSNTRKFRLDLESLGGADSDELKVVADNTGTWYLNVSYDSGASAYEIGVNDSGSYSSCTTATAPFSIDFSEKTVDGTDCPALDLESVSAPYTVEIRNGSAVDGKYTLVVDGSQGSDLSSSQYENVLYSMDVDLVYWSSDVRYRSTIRVAPGEIDG